MSNVPRKSGMMGAILIKKKYVGARQAKPTQAAKKAAGTGKKKLVTVLALTAAAVVLAVLLAGFVLKGSETIYPNVTAGGVAVGGMHRDEAVAALEAYAAETYGSKIMKIGLSEGGTLSLLPAQTKAAIDATAAADLAVAYGRSKGPITALVRWLHCRGNVNDVDISSALSFDEDYLHRVAKDAAAGLQTELKQSEVSYDETAKTLTIKVGTSRRVADADALYAAMVDAYSRGDFENTVYEYELTPFDKVDLQEYYEKYGSPMTDASYDKATNTMTKEVLGFGFDVEEEQKRLDAADEGSEVVIEFGDMVPEVTVETLKKEIFPDVLASYSSPHTAIPARTNNLILASAAINNTILNPGEVFSFNKIVGERTAAKGYKAATVYLGGGESSPELGGGVCQVASTIYMCTLLADLEIVERTEHMFAVTYVPMGMDATIYWGSLDFKFRNSLDNPICIEASVSDGKNHITILGTRQTDETIKMTYSVLATIPWEDVEEVDETQPPEYKEVTVTPYTGYKVQTYKQRYDKDGNLISSTKEAFSNYKKRDRVTTVGLKPEEVDPNAPTDPDVPVTPETPVTPEAPVTPEVPETSVTPEVPAVSETPATPEVPQEPVTE